ncbi:OmpP1/FadL family transporter [Psychrobium sp. 1_MG-2023]|uniref:OmpP1/FadL family transporter n=1 Tax=Psychrobium sp. 1_MG-2023 TaxID=3062624 RepID=UPI0026918F56|nr:OmpP1/FadL family transporter [Psychrobium sp. 1_MG-2023]MDP2562968.1 OmpP1/FadL family transporter [Psychrobium sp. 1_MG-2023]
MIKRITLSLVALAVASTFTAPTQAAGFKLYEQSTSAMGNAYAGRGAQINDASVGYSNPAAFVKLDQAQYSVGLNVLNLDGEFKNAKATSAPGLPVTGKEADTLSSISAIPHFHYYQPLNNKLGFGLSVAVPFATSSEYEDDFVGRYFAKQTEFKVISVQPAISYLVNDKLSIGAAVAINYASGTLSKFKDHNGLCEIGSGINATYSQLSQGTFNDVAQSAYCDSFYEVSGDDLKLSYTLGLHYQATDALALALSYQSAVDYTLEGDSTINNTPITGEFVPFTPNPEQYWTAPTIPGIVDGSKMPVVDLTTGKLAVSPAKSEASTLDLNTPMSVALSADYKVNTELSIQLGAIWTQWSKFTDISVLSADSKPSISASTQQEQNLNAPGHIGYIPEYWQDVWAYSVGATYQVNDQWQIKAGIAEDKSPVNGQYRSARIPANDRTWLTVGANYQNNESWNVDFAAGLMHMKETTVIDGEYNAQDVALYNSMYQADYKINAYVVSLQFNYFL